MRQYLIDSNIIIDFLREKEKAVVFLDSLKEIIVSTITVGEIYQGVRNKKELKFAKSFFKTTRILAIDKQISELTLRLMEKYTLSHGLLILDAMIAASAIKHNLALMTGNIKHFKMIKELSLVSGQGSV